MAWPARDSALCRGHSLALALARAPHLSRGRTFLDRFLLSSNYSIFIHKDTFAFDGLS